MFARSVNNYCIHFKPLYHYIILSHYIVSDEISLNHGGSKTKIHRVSIKKTSKIIFVITTSNHQIW